MTNDRIREGVQERIALVQRMLPLLEKALYEWAEKNGHKRSISEEDDFLLDCFMEKESFEVLKELYSARRFKTDTWLVMREIADEVGIRFEQCRRVMDEKGSEDSFSIGQLVRVIGPGDRGEIMRGRHAGDGHAEFLVRINDGVSPGPEVWIHATSLEHAPVEDKYVE